jgi:hypothetical protein
MSNVNAAVWHQGYPHDSGCRAKQTETPGSQTELTCAHALSVNLLGSHAITLGDRALASCNSNASVRDKEGALEMHLLHRFRLSSLNGTRLPVSFVHSPRPSNCKASVSAAQSLSYQ